MNLLLDTHILLWSLGKPEALAESHRLAIENPQNEVWVSSISLWEIATKVQIGKLTKPRRMEEEMLELAFRALPFNHEHALEVLRLPLYHRDPFDRALIAQARKENFHLITADRELFQYREIVNLL